MSKKIILTSAIVLFMCLTAFSQDVTSNDKWYGSQVLPPNSSSRVLSFEVRGKYQRPVKEKKLDDARSIIDLIPGYPVNWISDYVSVMILATCNGNAAKAVGTNDVLTTEQKNILKKVDLGAEIVIKVNYKSGNTAGKIENNTMTVSLTVVPETEAEFTGGRQQMEKYFIENVINKISEITSELVQDAGAGIAFTVNEDGVIVNAKISKTSGDKKTDKLLIEAIHNMPKWNPAVNSKNLKVKQDFEFSIGGGGC